MKRAVFLALISIPFVVGTPFTARAGDGDFLRGDVDGDGRVIALVDAYHLLEFAFGVGDDPPCLDAADVDDNELIFPLLDSLRLLDWTFGTASEPPSPGPTRCGADPAGDLIDCKTPPDVCPAEALDDTPIPDYVLEISSSFGGLDQTATVTVTLNNNGDDDVQGYQFGVCHDDTMVTLEDEDVAVNQDSEDLDTTFLAIAAHDGGWTAGTLLNVISAEVIESGEERDLFDATYSLLEAGTAFLDFCESLGTPAIQTFLLVDGAPLIPETEGGTIEIMDGNADYLLEVDAPDTGIIGDTGIVTVTLTNAGVALDGYQFAVCHDSLVGLDSDQTIELGAALDDAQFSFHSLTALDDAWNVGCIFDLVDGDPLEPGAGLELYRPRYELLEVGTSVFTFCTNGLDPEALSVLAEGNDEEPLAFGRTIEIVDEVVFIRGDVDSDGVTFALIDAIYLLVWSFESGPTPPCFDAADVNDDGELVGIIDSISLLTYTFLAGAAPPDPGPDECGADPTDDELQCFNPATECE